MLYLRRFYRSAPPVGGGGTDDPASYQQPITVTIQPGCDPVRGAFIQVQSTVYDVLSKASTSTVLVYKDAGYTKQVGTSHSPYVNGRATDTIYLPVGGVTYYVRVYAADTITTSKTTDVPACGTPPPAYPADGTYLRTSCNGTNLQKVIADGSGGSKWGDVVAYNSSQCIVSPDPGPGPVPGPVYGCTDPEALNYNPDATADNGTCEYPVRMTATLPPALTVAGNPITIELGSGPTGRTAAQATALLTVGVLGEATEIVVNGSVLRFSLTPRAGEFYDAQTLADALQEDVVIDQLYGITQPAAGQVLLKALRGGSAYTPVITTTSSSILVVVTEGVDTFRSQTKKDWGCYVEIWACAGSYGSAVDKDTAMLVGRLERLYTPGNSYRFGLEATLRRNLRHGLFTEADRMQAYYVRYGETYVPEGQVQAKRAPLGESDVLWAMEGALPFSQPNELTAPLLLNQMPGTLDAPLHGFFYAEALYALVKAEAVLTLQAKFVSYTGAKTSETITTTGPAAGGVVKVPLAPVFARAQQLNTAARLLCCELTLTATLATATATLGTIRYNLSRYTPHSRCVVFASSLGAYEAVWMEGVPESSTKRSANSYAKGTSGITTTSGRSRAVAGVTLEETLRLNTSLLGKSGFDYLRRELAASPDVFLFDPPSGIYTSANISGMELKADEVNQEYYISFDLEPGVPYNPLRN